MFVSIQPAPSLPLLSLCMFYNVCCVVRVFVVVVHAFVAFIFKWQKSDWDTTFGSNSCDVNLMNIIEMKRRILGC